MEKKKREKPGPKLKYGENLKRVQSRVPESWKRYLDTKYIRDAIEEKLIRDGHIISDHTTKQEGL